MRKESVFVFAFLLISLFVVFCSCDESLRIMKVELGNFPENIVYYTGDNNSLDLTGCTLITTIKSGEEHNEPINTAHYVEITDNIDFSTPGIYEVKITWMDSLVGRIPIQVIASEEMT